MKNQKEAYFAAITNVMSEAGVEFVEGETVVKDSFTSEMRDQVIEVVMAGFRAGTIAIKDTPSNQEKLADDAKLRDYSKSTLTNWFLKDTRLNGGTKHFIKNKGSRAGQGDKVVKNYKALLGQFEAGSDKYNIIQAKISERQAEIKASKTKTQEVNLDLLSPELKEALGL